MPGSRSEKCFSRAGLDSFDSTKEDAARAARVRIWGDGEPHVDVRPVRTNQRGGTLHLTQSGINSPGLEQWSTTLVLRAHCPVCLRCFPYSNT